MRNVPTSRIKKTITKTRKLEGTKFYYFLFRVFTPLWFYDKKTDYISGLSSQYSKGADQIDHFSDGLFHSRQYRPRNNTVANTEFIDFFETAEGLDALVA